MTRPTMSPAFDQRIADWLESDPDDAPAAVVETVLAAFPSIPQRRSSRLSWGFRSTTLTARMLAGAGAIAVVLAGGTFILGPGDSPGVAGTPPPSASSSPAPSSPAASAPVQAEVTTEFTSLRYGYAVTRPARWVVSPATTSWTPGVKNDWGSGVNDEIAGTGARFSGAAQPLAPGQTADAWLRTYASLYQAQLGSNQDPAAWPVVGIDGLVGRIAFDGVPSGGGVAYDAVVISGRLAYNFNMDGDVDRATFEQVLATIRLADVPVLDTAFVSPLGGYSMRRPSAWTVAPATKVWAVDDYANFDTALSDVLGEGRMFMGSSTLLARGETFEQWYGRYDAFRRAGTCSAPVAQEAISIDGLNAFLDLHCPTTYFEAVVSKGDRAYVFTTWSPSSIPIFASMLDTVRLTPSTAKR